MILNNSQRCLPTVGFLDVKIKPKIKLLMWIFKSGNDK